MTKREQIENEAAEDLKKFLKPGDTVYTVLRHRASNGMSRRIDCYVMEDNQPRWITRLVARACGFRFNEKHEALVVGGCGMDMGFHVVYTLSRVLFRDSFECIGKGCPANDHNNAYSASVQGQCLVCDSAVNGSQLKRRNGESVHSYPVCSRKCQRGPWKHSDGGYALRHKWM